MIPIPPWKSTKPHINRRVLDAMTESGARRLCNTIEAAWRKAGHDNVKAWTEAMKVQRGKTHLETYYSVRSNLINGLPPITP